MSLEINVSFLKDLERALYDRITAADLSTVLSVASDVLQHYEFARMLRMDESIGLDLLEAYTAALKVQCRSPRTVERYEYVINHLTRDLQTPIRNITVYHLRRWIAKEQERGISDGTLEGQREVFSAFFGWLWREGLIEKNPVNNLGAIKVQKKILKAYDPVEIENLKSVCCSLRDIAIVCFLLATGCRISEVTSLDKTKLDFVGKEVTVLGKGNKERIVYFDDVTAMHLQRYLDDRTDDNPALFVGRRNERLTPNGIRRMLNRLAAAAGVEHVHPHKFRRTLATTLIAHGMPIQEVAAILGHEKLDTTMKYVVLDKTSVKHDYRKFA